MEYLKQKGFINKQAKIKHYQAVQRQINQYSHQKSKSGSRYLDKQVIWKPLVGDSHVIFADLNNFKKVRT